MALAVDTFNNAGSANNTGQTFALTLAAGANLLVIGQGERIAPSAAPSWNGSNAGVTLAVGAGSAGVRSYLYYLANPTTGTHNVVTTNGSDWNSPGAISFTGASTTITNTAQVDSGASSNNFSSTCVSSVGSIVVDYTNNGQGEVMTATGSGQTRRWETHVANGIAMSTTTGATTTTVGYSQSTPNAWSMALMSIDAAGGGGSSFIPKIIMS